MIQPTIGRVVHYYPATWETNIGFYLHKEHAAITEVHSDTLVNLRVFNRYGESFARTSVQLIHSDEPVGYRICTWMPFQKGQATKTDDLAGTLLKRIENLEKRLGPLFGGTGNDTLSASGGSSITLVAGGGNDTLSSGGGGKTGGSSITMLAGAGNDTLPAVPSPWCPEHTR